MVSSYGLYIEYDSSYDIFGNYQVKTKIYMGNDEMGNWDYIIARSILWLIIIIGLFIMAFMNYRMKLARQAREDTMFYKMYRNLISIDPDFENKNEMEKQFVITQLHDDLHEICNHDFFEKEAIKSSNAIEDEICHAKMPFANAFAKRKRTNFNDLLGNYTMNKRYNLI